MVEVRSGEVSSINIESSQSWISVKQYLPESSSESKGDWFGEYFCLVERERTQESFSFSSEKGGNIKKSLELCYFNSPSNSFQDSNREFVKVTHWSPIPREPEHNKIELSREEMNLKIELGELIQFSHIDFNKFRINSKLDGMNDVYKKMAPWYVSYDDDVYFSVLRDEDGMEDILFCKLA